MAKQVEESLLRASASVTCDVNPPLVHRPWRVVCHACPYVCSGLVDQDNGIDVAHVHLAIEHHVEQQDMHERVSVPGDRRVFTIEETDVTKRKKTRADREDLEDIGEAPDSTQPTVSSAEDFIVDFGTNMATVNDGADITTEYDNPTDRGALPAEDHRTGHGVAEVDFTHEQE